MESPPSLDILSYPSIMFPIMDTAPALLPIPLYDYEVLVRYKGVSMAKKRKSLKKIKMPKMPMRKKKKMLMKRMIVH